MAFLYECGHCGAFYQTKAAHLSTARHQLTCLNCSNKNIFGAPTPEFSTEPVIEQVAPDKLNDFLPSNHSIPVVDIAWECGICESKYKMNSSSISEYGSKVTCQTCFNFIVLRHIASSDDLDYIQTLDISQPTACDVTPEKKPAIKDILTADRLFDETSLVGQHERIDTAQDPEHMIETFISHAHDEASHQTLIQSGYADPRKNKRDVVFPKETQDSLKEPMQDDINAPSDLQTFDLSESASLRPKDQVKPLIKEKKKKKITLSQEVTTHAEDVLEPVNSEQAAEIEKAYADPEQSFIAYQEFKENETFTYSIKEDEIKEINPDDMLPKVVQTVEKNMIKISLIVSVVLVILLVAFMMFQKTTSEKRAKQQEVETQQRLKEIEQDSSNSKYGFPEIQESETLPETIAE